jgi:hypothetical protein
MASHFHSFDLGRRHLSDLHDWHLYPETIIRSVDTDCTPSCWDTVLVLVRPQDAQATKRLC